MPHFPRFAYRFIVLALALALTSCIPPEADNGEEEQVPAPKVVSIPAPPAPLPPPAKASSLAPEPKPEEYAPPSRLGKDEAAQAAQGVFAPPTHIGEAAKATTVKVGLLIPITGGSKALGQSLLDAAVLAIYDKYGVLSPREITAKVELIPEDTGDTVEGAEKAAQDAIQAGATLLLGPVFGKQVNAVASIARVRHIPVITFSNIAGIAGNGVYLFGFMPEQQVQRIVQYATAHNITSIAALVPSNPYGAAIVKQLSSEVKKKGGRAYPIEYYPEDMRALDVNVGRLARFIQDEPGKGRALFIAEGSQKLKTLTDALAANGVTSAGIQFLGTGLWDDPAVLHWPALFGGLFASSPPEKYHAFEQHFYATYGYKPERRASLSYDAVALAATVAINAKGEGFPANMLTDQVGFAGPANGIFRFHDDGTIERGLSVLMITPQGFSTIEPAPTSFIQ